MYSSTPFVGTDAVRAGVLTERELRRSCMRIYRNVYQRRGSGLTSRERALLGAEWVDPHAPAELITDRTRPPRLIITRYETLLAGETTTVDGIPVTSPARTAFDLCRRPGLQTAVARIDALVRATELTIDDVAPLVDLHRGARGNKQLRRVLPLVDAGAESPQETRTRRVLAAGGLPRPQTQDMGWPQWLVGVEYDGPQHWTDPRIRANDIERTVYLQRRGWRLVRVSSELLRDRPTVIVARARDALRLNRETVSIDTFVE